MMPKPSHNKRNNNVRNNQDIFSSEKLLLETKPSFWLYSDNFILKLIVLFLLVFMFAPVMAFVYTLHAELVENFHIAIDNVMFYTELLLFILILIVIIKLILDILDWNYTNYIFTDARIIIQRGFIHKEKIMISYNKIQDLEIRQSLIERIMSVGDIIIYGANDMSETILDDIPSPKKAEEVILTRMNDIGFGNQNTYMNNNYQQNPYNQPYPNNQPNQTYYQQNSEYIRPEHNQEFNNSQQNTYYDSDYIQPEHTQNSNYVNNENFSQHSDTWDKQTVSTKKLDKDQIIRKHNEMFKRHKK